MAAGIPDDAGSRKAGSRARWATPMVPMAVTLSGLKSMLTSYVMQAAEREAAMHDRHHRKWHLPHLAHRHPQQSPAHATDAPASVSAREPLEAEQHWPHRYGQCMSCGTPDLHGHASWFPVVLLRGPHTCSLAELAAWTEHAKVGNLLHIPA